MFRRSFLTAATAIGLVSASLAPALADGQAKDIVDTAAGAGSFGTLIAAVTAADLVDTLKRPGPFTVFAPTDEAFAALPEGTVESLLLPENKDQLVAVLTYHVLPVKVMAADLPVDGRIDVTTIQGTTARIDTRHGAKIDAANIVTTDIAAANGVIHVIDAVILP